MPESKSRRETPAPRPRPRPRPDAAPPDDADIPENGRGDYRPEPPARAEPPAPPVANQRGPDDRPRQFDEDYEVFDEEINNRYEEIKRGSTHISELQGMTMPQLLKVAKEEGLTDYTGLKKQDLIFRILKERVKQNGLMFGEGTLE